MWKLLNLRLPITIWLMTNKWRACINIKKNKNSTSDRINFEIQGEKVDFSVFMKEKNFSLTSSNIPGTIGISLPVKGKRLQHLSPNQMTYLSWLVKLPVQISFPCLALFLYRVKKFHVQLTSSALCVDENLLQNICIDMPLHKN